VLVGPSPRRPRAQPHPAFVPLLALRPNRVYASFERWSPSIARLGSIRLTHEGSRCRGRRRCSASKMLWSSRHRARSRDVEDVLEMRKRQPGHWCWCCGRVRANERFSGHGHSKHLCRECAKLGPDELAFRQAVRDIDRCTDGSGVILRKMRKQFDHFIEHADARVRAYAEKILVGDILQRELWRMEREVDDSLLEDSMDDGLDRSRSAELEPF
jgi:hypothetical protein